MNDYKIIAYTADHGEIEDIITERTERAACDSFKKAHKGGTYDIFHVEVIRENTCATKQQEWDTLKSIKKMVEQLGPQSYLATAFEGCFEDAEQNIENDWGRSQKQLADAAAQRVIELEKKVEELKAQKNLMQETIDRLQQENVAMEAQQVITPDLAHLIQLAEKDLTEAEQRRDEATQKIVAYAENPTSVEFQQALVDHQNAAFSVIVKQNRLTRLQDIQNARKEA